MKCNNFDLIIDEYGVVLGRASLFTDCLKIMAND